MEKRVIGVAYGLSRDPGFHMSFQSALRQSLPLLSPEAILQPAIRCLFSTAQIYHSS